MKLKYYLRGLGIGIIITTIILMIAFSLHEPQISDSEIITRATELGMVMRDDILFDNSTEREETETTEATDDTADGADEGTGTEQADADGVSTEVLGTETAENAPEVSEPESFENTPDAQNTENYLLTVSSGEVCRNVCEDLQANGLIDDAEAFRIYLASVGFASSIVSGNYSIPYNLTYEEIYHILREGPMA